MEGTDLQGGSDRRRVVVLGSGPALATAAQDNTSFLLETEVGNLLIDCGGSPFHKLLRAGSNPARLGGVLLTHAHPDHIYGLPSLLHEMWLDGRRDVLHIYANQHTLEVALSLLDVFALRRKLLFILELLASNLPGITNNRFAPTPAICSATIVWTP